MRLLGLDGCKHHAWVVAESDSNFNSVQFYMLTDLKPLFDEPARGDAVAVLRDLATIAGSNRRLQPLGHLSARRPNIITFKDAPSLVALGFIATRSEIPARAHTRPQRA
jgi:hypothetical protein